MAYIGQNPIDAFRGLAAYDTFTGDGSTTTFDLTKVAPDGGQNDILVVVNNVVTAIIKELHLTQRQKVLMKSISLIQAEQQPYFKFQIMPLLQQN